MNNTAPNPQALREALAAVQHEIWSHWMAYLFSVCERRSDGSVVIPPEPAEHWQRQVKAAYDQLSEAEKESDREQADKIIAVLRALRQK